MYHWSGSSNRSRCPDRRLAGRVSPRPVLQRGQRHAILVCFPAPRTKRKTCVCPKQKVGGMPFPGCRNSTPCTGKAASLGERKLASEHIHHVTKKCYSYREEYYSASKTNELMPVAATWMDLETITLAELSQKEQCKCYMRPLIRGIEYRAQRNWSTRQKTDSQTQGTDSWLPWGRDGVGGWD